MSGREKREIMQHTREIHFGGLEPIGAHTAGTDISGVVTLLPPSGSANMLLLQSLDQNAYYTLDGTNPIPTGTSTGFLLTADDPPVAIPVGATTIVKIVQGTATARLQYQWSE